MKRRTLLLISAISLAACGQSGPATPGLSQTAPLAVPSGWVVPKFTLHISQVQKQATDFMGNGKSVQYVTANVASVKITLNTVNTGTPPPGLTTSVTTNIAGGSCSTSCVVNGPPVPPGTDNFTVSAYDASNATGNTISTYTGDQTISAGSSNSVSVTLNGVPSTFSITSVPSATAGTAFGSAQTISLAVKDADGNTITGTYANAVTLADSDTSSLSHASSLILNSGSAASSISVSGSSDVVKLNYGGQAIAQATLTASATGATNGTAHFTPTLSAIVPSPSEVDLYATSGTGSTGTIAVSETGWSNSPYSQLFTVSVPVGCANIATVTGNTTSTTGTSFTVTAVGSPAAGSCTITFTDGAGQSQTATLTYTTTSFNAN